MRKILVFAAAALLLAGCRHQQEATPKAAAIDYTQVSVPDFCADSAYAYAEAQVGFGPRIPGSRAAKECAAFLAAHMRRVCDTAMVQTFQAELWDGSRVEGRNIIGSINPQAGKRILLAAHWDSRLWADHDADEANWKKPVPGANDGASGTAALMEMARVMSAQRPSVGVDFVLFDMEDQGVPEWAEVYEDNSWCKGSQYWGQNRHVPYYMAVYGVLFDMVGTQQPRFTQEEVSRHFAPGLVGKVWGCAAALGLGNMFVGHSSSAILDDHLYVNQLTGIPMIDIVQNSPEGNFFAHWHTVTDDMQALNATTIKSVADVVMKVIYGDFPTQ